MDYKEIIQQNREAAARRAAEKANQPRINFEHLVQKFGLIGIIFGLLVCPHLNPS